MPDLQFETAEFTHPAPGEPCAVCKQPLAGPYFLGGAAKVCAACRDRIDAAIRRAPTALELLRAAGMGLLAAMIGGLAWWGVRVATGVEFGILAIGVAWLVAEGVKRGGGRGLPQQLLAVALTYLAIVGSYVPNLYVPDESPIVALAGVGIGAVALPWLIIQSGGYLWFVIVGIALWSAFRRTARLQLALQGPYDAPPPVVGP